MLIYLKNDASGAGTRGNFVWEIRRNACIFVKQAFERKLVQPFLASDELVAVGVVVVADGFELLGYVGELVGADVEAVGEGFKAFIVVAELSVYVAE